ncbi:MAG: DUF1326 domain-containing protein [Acidobacteria bacterium]|nr:DUF1326 domain-containing protein [Acidobacteriota bacterium]
MSNFSLAVLLGTLLLAWQPSILAAQIYGDYVETRSADVYTGPCFANGEVGLAGDQAILAWRVEKGNWDGVRLDGLSVVGVAKAGATLGDPYSNPFPARAVLIVDEKATAQQRAALASFARAMAGELLENVLQVEAAPIRFDVERSGGHPSRARLQAGDLAAIETRPIGENDHLCGNEETFYRPLAATAHAMPAVALLDQYSGPGLGVSWMSQGKRSAFVGSFSR